MSRRSPLTPTKPISTGLWIPQARREAEAHLLRLLGPAGNPARERLFRMNVTMCLHRALTDEEVDAAGPALRTDAPTDLAGGPIEILRETEEGLETTKPCHNPTRVGMDPRDALLWLPFDCTKCPPCIARMALQEERDLATGTATAYLEDTMRERGILP